MFTLLIGLLTLQLFEAGNRLRPGLGWAAAVAVIAAAQALALFEGRGRYFLFILVFYLTDRWPVRKRALLWLVLLPLARYAFTWDVAVQALFGTLEPRWMLLWLINAMGPFLGVMLTFFTTESVAPPSPWTNTCGTPSTPPIC